MPRTAPPLPGALNSEGGRTSQSAWAVLTTCHRRGGSSNREGFLLVLESSVVRTPSLAGPSLPSRCVLARHRGSERREREEIPTNTHTHTEGEEGGSEGEKHYIYTEGDREGRKREREGGRVREIGGGGRGEGEGKRLFCTHTKWGEGRRESEPALGSLPLPMRTRTPIMEASPS